MKFWKDITTGKDNQTHDVARFIITINGLILVLVLLIGVALFSYSYFTNKVFDIQTLFTATLTYVGGVGTLMTTGAAAIYFKQGSEPSVTIEQVKSVSQVSQNGDSSSYTQGTETKISS